MLERFEQHPKSDLIIFLVFSFLAFWMHHLSQSAILIYSLKPVEVFLHEASHGLATLLTGNQIESLHLDWRGGHVVSRFLGDSRLERIIVAFSGYAGASFWGLLIYATSVYSSKMIRVLLLMLSACSFFLVDGLMTGLILGFVIVLFAFGWYFDRAGNYFLRFLGLFVMLNSIYSPTYLFSYHQTGDHVSLSQLSFLPSFVFILIWVAIGLYTLWLAYRLTLSKSKTESASARTLKVSTFK
ncbi:M50 family metallopeptidase [Vibrio ostreicida]|uniref:M50 family metallopeptidase n=1 Tax=Vibrio ostreicida TaxID=526588 RepID=A0ABT8BRH8_9VIBR|nr:M50 family metallopeptidase [Vibrio ostreicida]MDN3609558.1 M50 family metallopeptidase [Vibrio ostreicida]NPD08434.1 M50 family metallopeptidase [Vibrio ostreicida]